MIPAYLARRSGETSPGSDWNRILEHWSGRRLDEPTPSEIRQLMAYVKSEQLPVHRAIMVVDVERFGDRSRTNLNQLAIRKGLYKALSQAYRQSRITWANCLSEDRGDGALILIPPDVPKTRLVTSLPVVLAAAVTRHNARHTVPEQMRLRVALHAGEIYHDEYGVAGAAVNHAFRLAEAPALRSALGASPGVLALIVSDWLFDEVIRHDPAAVPGLYRQVQVTVKETTAVAWIRVPEPGIAQTAVSADSCASFQSSEAALRASSLRATCGLVSGTGGAVGVLGSSLSVPDGFAGSGRDVRTIPAQLPHDAAGFTGRELELAALDALALAEGSTAVVISAIDGVAGIGKTALAVHFGHRIAAAFPDGQVYVDLRGFDPDQPPLAPRDVLLRFLRALGADSVRLPTDVDELASTYRSLLSGRRVLVVLDNAATSEQVRPLLPGAAGCLTVVTSRNRLSGLVARDGAHRLTLDVLAPAEAIALLAEIVGSERVTAEPAAAETLTRLCGWLPLALRIAADRATMHRHLTLDDLVDELTAEHDRLDVLSADEAASQIRAVFSWSYRALPPGAARAFRLLSLHVGQDISAPAAAALIGATIPETRRLLATLTSGHLLEETGRDRYQFHDLVRVYAAECAQNSEPEPQRMAAIRRLLVWYLHTADAFSRIFIPGARRVPLDPPGPAIRPLVFATHQQAVDWAKTELANLAPIAAQATAIGDDATAGKLAAALMPIFALYRRMTDLVAPLHSAVSAAERLGDRDTEAWLLSRLAEAYLHTARSAQAADLCQRALAISSETGDSWGQWVALHDQGLSFLRLQRFDDALSCFQQALAAARQASDLRSEGLSLTGLGVAYRHLEALDAAIDVCTKALTILKGTQNKWNLAWVLQSLAEAHYDHGCPSDAVDLYQQSLAILRQVGDRWQEAENLEALGQAQRAAGQPNAAQQSWHQAVIIFAEFGDERADRIRSQLENLSGEEDQLNQ